MNVIYAICIEIIQSLKRATNTKKTFAGLTNIMILYFQCHLCIQKLP